MATRGSKSRTAEIREYIVENVSAHPADISGRVAEAFGISRQAAQRHVKQLIADGILVSHGETRSTRYELKPIAEETFTFRLTPDLQEDVVWRENVRPLLEGVPRNVLDICAYGFTEILNNAIEHSGGSQVLIGFRYTPTNIAMMVRDDGIGIFKKIQTELHLEDERHAILELSKGKLTTDPAHHTGEGIFFTSRAFDSFRILSGGLYFFHAEPGDDWLLEDRPSSERTAVFMDIHPQSSRKLQDVFDKYTSDQDDYGFNRTHVLVALARYGDENLVSRSQAKRLLARFDRFEEVVLDFKGVETIGQALADEIFRVYANQNPQINLVWVNATEQVKKMIFRAKNQS